MLKWLLKIFKDTIALWFIESSLRARVSILLSTEASLTSTSLP
jgi:hypothetical protein